LSSGTLSSTSASNESFPVVEIRRGLRDLIRQLSPRIPGPTIYVTHDEGDLRDLAERIVRLEKRELSEVGTERGSSGELSMNWRPKEHEFD
jgi:ABC-type Fe3+/spermidine/putrescine transport system ATPase subunit